MNDHFSPVGNPAPPRPRRPEAFISLMMPSRPLSKIALVPSHAPRARAPFSPQSWSPYRFLKMRSLSASMVRSRGFRLVGGRLVADRRLRRAGVAHVLRRARTLRVVVGQRRRAATAATFAVGIERRIGQRERTADRGGELTVDLRTGLRRASRGEFVE